MTRTILRDHASRPPKRGGKGSLTQRSFLTASAHAAESELPMTGQWVRTPVRSPGVSRLPLGRRGPAGRTAGGATYSLRTMSRHSRTEPVEATASRPPRPARCGRQGLVGQAADHGYGAWRAWAIADRSLSRPHGRPVSQAGSGMHAHAADPSSTPQSRAPAAIARTR